MNVTKEAILTAMVSLILGYRDKYAPATESEALNKLQAMLPEDASLLTLELAFNKLLGLVGTSLSKLSTSKDLLDAVDSIVALTKKLPDKATAPYWFKEILEEIRKNPVTLPVPKVIPMTPSPVPCHPWVNPGTYPRPWWEDPWSTGDIPEWMKVRYPSDPQYMHLTPDITCQDQTKID
ncbi:MAG: hypothetical protein E6R03_09050 [Hyphomicrobiaceae bacterium]|nr:MAG: hypothetical protein E6R03_09050 [Hyphomicrobiaceae bacterium]